jgi:hypothetical protein
MAYRAIHVLWLVVLVSLLNAEPARAQGAFRFLGPPRIVADQYSPRHGIRYNTQGYDHPKLKLQKKIAKLQKKGVPDWAIEQIVGFPGSADTIGDWIDDAFDTVRDQFTGCGGQLAEKASQLSPAGLYVTVMPSAFYEPYFQTMVAAAFYPGTLEIKVLNVYYTWDGANKGWLRHARDLIAWEMGNYFAYTLGVQTEPRPEGWPCISAQHQAAISLDIPRTEPRSWVPDERRRSSSNPLRLDRRPRAVASRLSPG